jgi:hypothetical protein
VLAEDDEQFMTMVRLRLTNSSLVSELGTFLERCECDVEQLGPRMLDVGVRHEINIEAALRQLGALNCYQCEEIAGSVFPGSPRCVDCRHGLREFDAAEARSPIRDEWTRMEVEAYVKVWQALHPEGHVELVT